MFKRLMAAAVLVPLLALPGAASAQSRGTLVGAGAGAAAGAVVGGPIGAVVGGVGGAYYGSKYNGRRSVKARPAHRKAARRHR